MSNVIFTQCSFDQESEIKAFEASKAGVKGLVDAGITKVPKLFIHKEFLLEAQNNNVSNNNGQCQVESIPLIDFQGINEGHRRKEVVEQVRSACMEYGFFQLINHNIPLETMDEMLLGVGRFHEQDVVVKKEYYSRDYDTKHVLYNSNFNLHQVKVAAWRDTLTFIRGSSPSNPLDLPSVCRDILIQYTDEVTKLGETIYEVLSEALGLEPNYLKDIGCNDAIFSLCNYYPACPDPKLTLGSTTHADSGFITILLQSNIPGLQVLYRDHWIDVVPIRGALVINIGNLMQLVTNNLFVSALHRVLASKEGPRMSMACIFRAHHHPENIARLYEPIKELLSTENRPLYRAVTVKEIISNKSSSKLGTVINALDKFKL